MSSNTVGQNLSKAFNTTKAQNSVKGAVNATKNRVNQAIAAISPYKDVILLILYVLVAAVIVYVAYAIMFPPPDLQEQVIIGTTQSATGLQTQVPVNNTIAIETGGEYTFSTWLT